MKTIQLTKGQIALVDDEDFQRFGAMKWAAQKSKHTGGFYAVRYAGGGRKHKKTGLLHREIMGNPPGMKIDHVNHDTLDCQKHNLRICTNSQNMANRSGLNSNSTSGIRGVSWSKTRRKWLAKIQVQGRQIIIGYFGDKSIAAHDFADAAKQNFGEYYGIGNR